MARMEIP